MVTSEQYGENAGLIRPVAHPSQVHVIAVTGGKGGVGKTNITTNLGIALARRGHEVMLLDADLGLANVDVLLGLRSTHTLAHVLNGEQSLEDIILDGPSGLKIVPGSSGIAEMAALSPTEHAGLVRAFSGLQTPIEYFLIDTAAGITQDVISFTRAAQDVIVVACDEPASITDAYALIKVLSRDHGVDHFHILANMVRNTQEGRDLYHKISGVSERFLDVVLDYLGAVPYDNRVRHAVQRQRAVVEAFPDSRSAASFHKLASMLERWPPPNGVRGHLEFFVERLMQSEVGGIG
jgi:flagellar biosynthesis protein FlhG